MNATTAVRGRSPPTDTDFYSAAKLLLQCLWVTKLAVLVSATVLLWDIISTIDTEVQHVWHFRWSFTKVVFLINRYGTLAWFGWHLFLAFAPCPSERFCRAAQGLDVAGGILLTILQSTVFVSRVWVIYGRTRLPLLLIVVSYAACIIPAIVLVTKGFLTRKTSHAIINYLTSLPELRDTAISCNFTDYPVHFVALLVSSLVYETALFLAIAWKFFSGEAHSGVLSFLYREEAVYYLIMMIALVSAIVCSLSGQFGFAFVGSGYTVAVKSVLTSHMLLRLKTFLNGDPSRGWRHSQTFGQAETQIRFALPDGRRRSEAATTPVWDIGGRVELGQDMEMITFAAPHDGGGGGGEEISSWQTTQADSTKNVQLDLDAWRPSASTSAATLPPETMHNVILSSGR